MKTKPSPHIGVELKKLRLLHNINPTQIAAESGLSISTIYKTESAKNKSPQYYTVEKIKETIIKLSKKK